MINKLISTVLEAGNEILKVYETDFTIQEKKDKSPITEADKISHEIIVRNLKNLIPEIPVISEEGDKEFIFADRFWLVDPLDGTKEFINRNGEFTINITLVEDYIPVLGVVFAPALGLLYFSQKGKGAYKVNIKTQQKIKLPVRQEIRENTLRVVVSRSHSDERTKKYLEKLSERFSIEKVSVGSSLKICLLVEGKADIYPRTGPTMEWDTAGAHAVLLEAEGVILSTKANMKCGEELRYGKENLKNPPFIAFRTRKLSEELCP